MSEERSGAPRPQAADSGVTAVAAADGRNLGHPSQPLQRIPSDPDATAEATDATPAPPTVKNEEERRGPRDGATAARRRGRTLRIPDDEVGRPTSEPPPVVRSNTAADSFEGASDTQVVTPTRIITINPSEGPSPPAEVTVPQAPPFSLPVDVEDSWTPLQPMASDIDAPLLVDPVEERAYVQPEGLTGGAFDEPEGEEVEFDDDVPTPVPVMAVSPRAMAAVEAVETADAERRSDPGAEIDADDLLAIEAIASPAKALANLPPIRARLESKPSVPPSEKPAPVKPGRPPLVIVPPHMGTLAPASDSVAGARRKGKLWWEELFNDDYLRTCERLDDEQIAREVNFIEDSLGIERGGTVLDLACGTGRHAIELSRRGYEVVGFDLSLAMLARAGDEAQDRSAKLNFIQGDMREMTFEEQFDGIYCWNTSFGYFDEEKNGVVVERIHRALKSEGLLLLDVVNRDFLIRQSPSLAWFEGEGCVCMDEMNVDFITSRLKVKRTIMLDDGRSRETEYSIRVYSLHELGRVLHEHGFKVCEVSGRIATPSVFFGNESSRILILAEKR